MLTRELMLYGELVLWLRNRAARLLAQGTLSSSEEELRDRLDAEIREWLFAPQDGLEGLCPRDVIRAEQGVPHLIDMFDP